MPSSPTALIVGAGIGGLAAGIALRRAGWNVRVFERAASPRELGFAIALAPNAIAALRELGIADVVLSRAAEVGVFEMRRGDGSVLNRFRLGDQARSAVLLRPALHGALLDAVGAETLTLGAVAESFAVDGERVTLRCAGGLSASGDILIGADGVGSVIRRQLHPHEPDPRPSGYHALRGVTSGAGQTGVDCAVYLADGIEAGFANASETAVYWYISLVDEFAADLPSGDAGLRAVVERSTRTLDDRFRAIAQSTRLEDLRFERLFTRAPLAEWGSGPVTLLGDAAHPVLPHTAQGAAQALEDAVALGIVLRDRRRANRQVGRGDAGSERPGLQEASTRGLQEGSRPGLQAASTPGLQEASRPGVQEALRRYEAVRARRTRQLIRLGPRIAAWTTTRSALRWRVRAIAIRMLSDWLFKQTLNAHARDPHRALRAWQA